MKKIVKLIIVLAAFAVLNILLSCQLIIEMDFKRKPNPLAQKILYMLLQALVKDSEVSKVADHSGEIRGLGGKIVSIRSADGLRLVGHYIPAEHAKRTVICVHGWHSGWDLDFSMIGPWLHGIGCNLLLIEQRAQGNSEGSYMTFGARESEDLLCWIRWYLKKRRAELPLYLFGVSMGAGTILLASDRLPEKKIAGMIVDSAYSSPYKVLHDFEWKGKSMPEHPILNFICLSLFIIKA